MRRSAMLLLLAALALPAAGCTGSGGWSLGARRPAWELPPPPVREAPVVQAERLTRLSLDNGLTLLALEDHRLPQVTLGVTVRRGAGSVEPERAGLAEYMAELMNRGAGERDAMALAQAVEDLGASLSVRADWDSVSVEVSGLARDRAFLAGILRDVVLHPRFDREEATKAREEQLASLEASQDDPGTLVGWHAMAVLYPGHRYGLPLSGTRESVARLDAGAARALHAAIFVPGDAILFAAGDLDAAPWVEEARALFGDWQPGPVPAATPPPPSTTPAARRIVVVDKPDLVQARIIVGHEGIARSDPRRIAVGLMNDVLGGSGFSSRLMQSLRADSGLTYGVGSGFVLRRQPGPFMVSTFTRVPEVRRALDILLSELTDIRGQRPPSAEDLAEARSYNVGQFGLGLETSDAVLGSLVELDVQGLPEDSLDTYRARLRAIGIEEVTAAARDLLHPDRAAIVVLGPAEALVPQLEGLGDVEVVSP